jgi:serine/threonine-protein phosphatase 5
LEKCGIPPSSYNGAIIPDDEKITKEWVLELMEDLKKEKYIAKKYLLQIMSSVKDYYEKQLSLIDVEIPDDVEFNVCGDIHGQFYDLVNIFNVFGAPSETNPFLFNGDFVDRGAFSVEVMTTLLCWKYLYPNHFHLTRGNHEAKSINKMYGFEAEVKRKYDEEIYECFAELFCYLPLGHVLNKKVLVVHGGIFSQDGVTLDQLKKIDRFREPPEKGEMCEILWADPCKQEGRHPSKRGVGLSFGPDVAKRFLDNNNLGNIFYIISYIFLYFLQSFIP